MATVIDEFMVKLELDGTAARNEADKIKRDMEKTAKDSGKEFEKAGDQAKKAGEKAKAGAKAAESSWSALATTLKDKLFGAAAAFTALYGIQSAFSSYLSTADAMGKFADSIGQNIEDVHAWSEAVIRSGGSAEGFQGSLKSLSTQLSKMSTTGRSRAGNILESVGIDAGEVGRARKSLDVMLEIADKMQGMSKEEALGFGASLGIDSGTIMLLQQGRDAVSDLIVKQKQLGVYTKEDARITAQFNDAVADSKQAFMSFASIIFRMVVPAFKSVVETVTEWVSYLRQHEVAVQAFFTMLAGVITYMLIPAFARLAKVMWRSPLTWVLAIIAALAIAFEDLYGWANGSKAAFSGLWEELFDGPEDAKKSFDTLYKTAKFTFKYIKDAPKRVVENFKSSFRQIEYWWKSLNFGKQFEGIEVNKFWEDTLAGWQTSFENTMVDLQNWCNENFTTDMFGIDAFLNDISNGFSETFTNIETLVGGIIDGMKNGFVNLKDTIISTISEAIDWAIGKLAELSAAIQATPIIGTAYNAIVGGGGGTTNNYEGHTVNSKFGNIIVNTQSTDAQGTGRAVAGALKNYNPAMANTGVGR